MGNLPFCISVLIVLLNGAFVDVHGLSAGDAFLQANLVPEFIPSAPESTLSVTYAGGTRNVDLGNQLEVEDTKSAPSVQWDADSDALYTLIMLDVDAPTPETRSLESPVLQWLANNIPGSDLEGGDNCIEYRVPAPTGLHRYAFVIYNQTGRIANDLVTDASGNVVRDHFSVQKYIGDHGLLGPVAGNFFFEQAVDVPSSI